jgi:hypothetical protein
MPWHREETEMFKKTALLTLIGITSVLTAASAHAFTIQSGDYKMTIDGYANFSTYAADCTGACHVPCRKHPYSGKVSVVVVVVVVVLSVRFLPGTSSSSRHPLVLVLVLVILFVFFLFLILILAFSCLGLVSVSVFVFVFVFVLARLAFRHLLLAFLSFGRLFLVVVGRVRQLVATGHAAARGAPRHVVVAVESVAVVAAMHAVVAICSCARFAPLARQR